MCKGAVDAAIAKFASTPIPVPIWKSRSAAGTTASAP